MDDLSSFATLRDFLIHATNEVMEHVLEMQLSYRSQHVYDYVDTYLEKQAKLTNPVFSSVEFRVIQEQIAVYYDRKVDYIEYSSINDPENRKAILTIKKNYQKELEAFIEAATKILQTPEQ